MGTTRVRRFGGPGRNWLLPALLALLVLAIILIAFFVSHPHVFGGGATATPTPTATPQATATPTVPPTATPVKGHARATPTPRPAPTTTPRPGPTGTPRPGPTATPRPNPKPRPTPTPTVRTGSISYPSSQLDTIQRGATQHNASYAYYLNPFQVVQHDLPRFGITTVNIVSPQPPPRPTPTPYTGDSGLPEVQMTVQYQGKRYLVVLDQPRQQGPQGIWVIVRIKPL